MKKLDEIAIVSIDLFDWRSHKFEMKKGNKIKNPFKKK